MLDYTYHPLGEEHIRLLKLYCAQNETAPLEGNLLVRRLHVNNRLPKSEPSFTLDHEYNISIETPGFHPSPSANNEQVDRTARTSSPEDNVQEAEPYEALSYTWGGRPDPSHIIRILDGGQAHSIPITANLESALLHLRPSSGVRFLWVDALSINQENPVEKGSQIPKIADIYNQATKVRVWLGEERDQSDVALKFIRRVLNLSHLDQLVQDELTSSGWAAFLDLMKRPWFSRRWILQEIALAREAYLHCGHESITWREFAEAVSLFTSKQHDVRKLFQGSPFYDHHPDFLGEIEQLGANRLVYASSNLFRKSDDGTIMEHLLSLEALMSSLSVFEASNPHDIIYAILWLANDATPSTEEIRGSSLSEPWVIHTPNRGSPCGEVESPTATSFHFPDLVGRSHQVSKELATNNAETNGSLQPRLTAGISNTITHSLQHHLALPIDGQKGLKRAATDLDQPRRKITILVKQAVDRKITVNYNKSVYEVCKDFLAFAMAQSESLDIICRPWAPDPDPKKEPDLPSWIPGLSRAPFELVDTIYKRVEADPLVGLPDMGRKTYHASGKCKAAWRFDENVSKSLFVRGFVLDKIKIKSETSQQGNIPAEWLNVVQWDHGKATAPDRFWRTLVADRGPDGGRPPCTYQSAFNYAFKHKGQRCDLNTREMILFGKCPSMAIDFLRRVQSVIWKRGLILTQRENFLGLAPSKAREGDLICILYGCSVPVVLSKKKRVAPANGSPASSLPTMKANGGEGPQPPKSDPSKSDHYYEFIGECYIHGMMDGEALRNQRTRRLPQQDFELR